jgi:hypothetical protein
MMAPSSLSPALGVRGGGQVTPAQFFWRYMDFISADIADALEIPKIQLEFLDWLVDPNKQPPTQKEWAENHDLNPSTLRLWKSDKRFRDAWEKRLSQLNIRPDRVQEVVDAMHEKAKRGIGPESVAAAKLYLEYINRIAPPKVVVEHKKVDKLSDEELAKALQGLKSD